jgi:anaerobic ribonucleoside-triphosphate reductase activating protein
MLLRIGATASATECEGPGRRFAIWVQGCRIRCAGCCNPQFFAARGGRLVSAAGLVEEIRCAAEPLEGITLLGGEPFDQAAGLAEVASGAHALGLSVMTFTGYLLEELRARSDPGTAALIRASDLLVDAPYDATRPESVRRWVGSTNQRFHFLSERYAPGIELPRAGEPRSRIELEITADGRLRIRGWPALADLR